MLVNFWGYIGDRAGLGDSLGVDATARTSSDLFVHTVNRYGLHGIDRLVGQFAAVLRHVSADRLALVRDHLGLVPLYWARRGSDIVANPDLEALRDQLWDVPDLDLDVIAAHLIPINDWPGQRTQFRGIQRVLPGSVTVVGTGSSKVVRYFDPRRVRPDLSIDPSEAVGHMRKAVTAAVADASVGRRVAVHLSGGIDSGVVSAMALRELARSGDEVVAAYSWTPRLQSGATEAPEQRLLRLAERHLGVRTHPVSYDDSKAAGLLDLDPLVYPQWGYLEYEWGVLTDAARRGVDTILSGWGGDDFASANTPIDPLNFIKGGRTGRLRAHMSRLAERSGRSNLRSAGGALRPSLERLLPPQSFDGRRRQHALEVWPLWSASHPHIVSSSPYGGRSPRTAQDRMVARAESMDLPWRADTWWKAGHSHGVEYRYPLLDQRVVRAALAMPPWYFHGEGLRRWGFRQLAAEWLPLECAMNEDKAEPLRVIELWSGDMWEDRVERNGRHSRELADLSRAQLVNRVIRWSGPDDVGSALGAALERVDLRISRC